MWVYSYTFMFHVYLKIINNFQIIIPPKNQYIS